MWLVVLVRGLQSRAVLTIGILLLATIGVASAVVGPAYFRAATNSLLLDRIAAEPTASAGLTWRLEPDSAGDPDGMMTAARRVGAERAPSEFADPRVSLMSDRFETEWPGVGATIVHAALIALDDGCARLLVDGRCPRRPFEVLVADRDAEDRGLGAGDRLAVAPGAPPVVVVGTYRLQDPAAASWFDPARFESISHSELEERNLTHAREVSIYFPARLVTVPSTFAELSPRQWWAQVDRALQVEPKLTPDRIQELAALTDAEHEREPVRVDGGSLSPVEVNGLRTIVDDVESEHDVARDTILPATLSLSLVALLLLLRLLGEGSDLRRPEFALLSLRGWSRTRLWVFGLAEPALVLVVAAPLGWLLGWWTVEWLAHAWLFRGLPVDVPLGSIVGVAAAVAGGLGAAGLALVRVMREPLREQLESTRRLAPPGRVELAGQAATVIAAGLVAYLVAARDGRGEPDLTDLLLPVLLALALGLVVGRLTVLASRWLAHRTGRGPRFRPGARPPALGGYLAIRRLARRREGALVVLPLAVALGVGVFAIGVQLAAASWRDSVAASRVGADLAYSTELPADRTLALTRQLDPDGRWLMAATVILRIPLTDTPPLVAIDTTRMATVGVWPSGFGDGDSATVAAELTPDGEPPLVEGTRLAVSLTHALDAKAPSVVLVLRDGTGREHEAALDLARRGPSTVRAPVPYCRDGCTLESIGVGGLAGLAEVLHGELTLRHLKVDGVRTDIGLTDAAAWRPERPYLGDGGESVVAVDADETGLRLRVDTGGRSQVALVTSTDVPDVRPIIATPDIRLPPAGGDALLLDTLSGGLPVRVVGTSHAVPLIGRSGILVDLTSYLREASLGLSVGAQSYVLARDDLPAELVDGLAAAGVDVDHPLSLAEEQHRLDNDAYALSLRLYVVVAAALLLLAMAGVTAYLVVGLPGRRQDAAALRVVGVSRRSVVRAGLVELGVTLGVAMAAGVLAGVAAQAVVLGQIRLRTADHLSPDIPAQLDLPTVGLYVAATSGLLFGLAAAIAWATVRRARAAELRESAR